MKYLLLLALLSINVSSFSQQWQWVRSYGGNGTDSTTDVKIRDGYLYVTGTFTSTEIKWENNTLLNKGGKDFFVAKLDTNGKTIWVRSYGDTGDDFAEQLEVNKYGRVILRCRSTSASLKIKNSVLVSPSNFLMAIDEDGNELNAVNVPIGLNTNDIDLDTEGNSYVAASYQRPFVFKGAYIDSTFGLAGATILKYDKNGIPIWTKVAQVRENTRYPIYNYSYPDTPGGGLVITYPAPITGNAFATIQIEYDESNAAINMTCDFLNAVRFENFYQLECPCTGYSRDNFRSSLTPEGEIIGVHPTERTTTFGPYTTVFETVPGTGTTFLSGGQSSISGTFPYILRIEQDTIAASGSWTQNDQGDQVSIPPVDLSSIRFSQRGDFILGSTDDYHFVILDSTFTPIKNIFIKEIDRFRKTNHYQNLATTNTCFNDTSSIYVGSLFADSALTLNAGMNTTVKTLSNNGSKDIFIGKLSLVNKHIYQQIENISICKKTSYTFPDGNIISNIENDTLHISNLMSVNGEDSIVTTILSVINIEASVEKNKNMLIVYGNAESYQWINCNNSNYVPGETSHTLSSLTAGDFAVILSGNGCSDTSTCYTIANEDLLNSCNASITVYPVPAQDEITIEIGAATDMTATLLIFDLSGKAVLSRKVILPAGKNKLAQNIKTLLKGEYSIMLRNSDLKNLTTKKFIKL